MSDRNAIEQTLAPLREFESSNTLQWRWRYRWRTWCDAGRWHAEVQAGYADDDWKPTGAFPLWGGSGADEITALAEAVYSAVNYWKLG